MRNGSTRRVPGYVLETELGRGASGEVWRARVAATGSPVAIKWIPLTGAEQARAARAEAAMLQTLDHPNLVRLHDVVPVPDALALVLDLAEGGTLAELVAARGSIAAGEAVAAMSAIAAALAVAHAAGVVHGDVTPANVLFTDIALPLLADLGVARVVGERRPARSTPAFVDPMVAIGGLPGPSSDVFMAAATTLFALTGRPLWPGTSADEALAHARAAQLNLDTRLADPRVPPALVRPLRRALELDPARRGTAAAFALELRHAVEPCAIELHAGRGRSAVSPARSAAAASAPPGPGSVSLPGAKLRWRALVAATSRRPGTSRGRDHGGDSGREPVGGHRPRHAAPVAAGSGVRLVPVRAPAVAGRASPAPAAARAAATASAAVPGRSDPAARPSFHRPAALFLAAADEPTGAAARAAGSGAADGGPADRSVGVPPGTPSALTHGVRARPVLLRPPRPNRRQQIVRTVLVACVVAALSVVTAVAIRSWISGAGRSPGAAGTQTRPTAVGSRPAVSSPARPSSAAPGPSLLSSTLAVLRQLAATRERAFATRDAGLLTAVYLPGPLLSADQALMLRIVPPGCGLVGATTTYRVTTASGDTARRVAEVTAAVAASQLVCAGQRRGQAAAGPATPLRITLQVAVPAGWRIAAVDPA